MAKFNVSNTSESIPFDNSSNGFTSDNMQDAIEEAKASGGSGSLAAHTLENNDIVTIETKLQMILHDKIIIKDSASLVINGELVLIK